MKISRLSFNGIPPLGESEHCEEINFSLNEV